MSQYNLPLEIDYQPFQSTDLAGQGPYLSGFPAIMAAMSEAAYIPTTSKLRELYDTHLYGIPANVLYQRKRWIYLCKGPQHCYAAPGKSFTQGQDIRFYNSAAVGSTKSVLAARVLSYDAKTGLMWFDAYSVLMGVDDTTVENNRIAVSKAVVTAFGGKQTIDEGTGYPRTIVSGGTGGLSDRDGLTNLTSRNVIRAAEYFNDFVSPAEGPVDVFNQAGVRRPRYNVAASTPSSHPGIIQLQVSATDTTMSAVINRYPGILTSTVSQVLGSSHILVGGYWEFEVYIPTLSNATNEYTLDIGGTAFYGGSPRAYIKLQYIRTTTVNWIMTVAAPGGGSSSTNTTTAVATGWHRIRITRTATNTWTFTVDGTSVGTMGNPFLSEQSLATLMGAYFSVTRVAGTSPIMEWDYFYGLNVYGVDRGS